MYGLIVFSLDTERKVKGRAAFGAPRWNAMLGVCFTIPSLCVCAKTTHELASFEKTGRAARTHLVQSMIRLVVVVAQQRHGLAFRRLPQRLQRNSSFEPKLPRGVDTLDWTYLMQDQHSPRGHRQSIISRFDKKAYSFFRL